MMILHHMPANAHSQPVQIPTVWSWDVNCLIYMHQGIFDIAFQFLATGTRNRKLSDPGDISLQLVDPEKPQVFLSCP